MCDFGYDGWKSAVMTSWVVGTRKTERMMAGTRVRERAGGSPWNTHLDQMAFFRGLWDL